jgi:hypothetical protein
MLIGSQKCYSTVKEAHNRLCLDIGWDPFKIYKLGRPTKAKLAEYGYNVDKKEVQRRQEKGEHRCSVCQEKLEAEWNRGNLIYPTECMDHRKYIFECDNGHKRNLTEQEAKAIDYTCPVCGEYFG